MIFDEIEQFKFNLGPLNYDMTYDFKLTWSYQNSDSAM